jgi:hypothetical protein
MDVDAGIWEQEFAEVRQRLLESSDFHDLYSRGHHLKNGVVLTSVSDVPFEVSLKCIYCGAAFWFENSGWSTGGMADWHLSSVSRRDAGASCSALAVGFQSRR